MTSAWAPVHVPVVPSVVSRPAGCSARSSPVLVQVVLECVDVHGLLHIARQRIVVLDYHMADFLLL